MNKLHQQVIRAKQKQTKWRGYFFSESSPMYKGMKSSGDPITTDPNFHWWGHPNTHPTLGSQWLNPTIDACNTLPAKVTSSEVQTPEKNRPKKHPKRKCKSSNINLRLIFSGVKLATFVVFRERLGKSLLIRFKKNIRGDHQGCFLNKISPIQKSWDFHYGPWLLLWVSLHQQYDQYIRIPLHWYFCFLEPHYYGPNFLPKKKWASTSLLTTLPLLRPFRTTTFSGQICESPNFPPRVAQRKRSVKQMMYNTPGQSSIVFWKKLKRKTSHIQLTVE